MRLEKTRFTKMLIQANGLDSDDFNSWVFHPGMLFGAPDKWWGDLGQRDFFHEGIDFCLYTDLSGRVTPIDPTTRIPAMHDGVVKALFDDYLGQAVIIEHHHAQVKTRTLFSMYAHTMPLNHFKPGLSVRQGDIIGTIADTRQSKSGILPHLHYTIGYPRSGFVYEPFVWNNLRDGERVTLLDPIHLLDCPHRVETWSPGSVVQV